MRATTELIARGMIFSGSAVSPAAVPTNSTAEYANTTPEVTISSGSQLVGNSPPWLFHKLNPVLWPSTGYRPAKKRFPPLGTPSAREP